jgi:hypothetical protein
MAPALLAQGQDVVGETGGQEVVCQGAGLGLIRCHREQIHSEKASQLPQDGLQAPAQGGETRLALLLTKDREKGYRPSRNVAQ